MFYLLVSRFVHICMLPHNFSPIIQCIQVVVWTWSCFSQKWLDTVPVFSVLAYFFFSKCSSNGHFQNAPCRFIYQHLQCSNGLNSSQKVHSRVQIILVRGNQDLSMGVPKQRWTSEEEAALRAGIARHGVGKWRTILKDPEFSSTLSSRSNVDLKVRIFRSILLT